MKVLTAFAVIVLAGWALIKVIWLAVRGLVHLLISGLPVLGAIAGVCLLLVLGSRIAARTRRQRSLQPSGPPAAPSCRATYVVPAPVLSPEWLVRPAAPASRPAQYRWQASAESGHAEASPASGPERSGTLSARPGLPGYGVAALGYGASVRPGGSGGGARGTVHRTGTVHRISRSPSGPARAAVPSWPGAAQALLPSSPSTPRPGNLAGLAKGMAMNGKDAGAPPHGESDDLAAAGTIGRIVLIDGCSGVQYGRGNEQYSVYRVTLPSVALESTEALARHLLNDNRQWSRDVFDHDGQASFAGLAGAGSAFGGAAEAVAGDTLVIIRNSRGVQVGNGNTQHNRFQIRVANVAIRAVQAGPAAASRAAVDQLCQHPSQATAETVARQIADAAREHLVVDLTAQVTREVGSPVIPGRPAEVSGRTGVQAGGSARAHVRVVVEVTTVKVNRLTTDLLEQARRDLAARMQAAETRAATLTTPARAAGRARPAPAGPLADRSLTASRTERIRSSRLLGEDLRRRPGWSCTTPWASPAPAAGRQ
jgi:RIP homotypic interaction motif